MAQSVPADTIVSKKEALEQKNLDTVKTYHREMQRQLEILIEKPNNQ